MKEKTYSTHFIGIYKDNKNKIQIGNLYPSILKKSFVANILNKRMKVVGFWNINFKKHEKNNIQGKQNNL